MQNHTLPIACIALWLINPVVGAGQQTTPQSKLVIQETLLAEIGSGANKESLVVSPDGRRVAYVETREGKQVVVVDGIAGKPYGGVRAETLRFSPDSKHLVYIASPTGEVLTAMIGAVATERFHIYALVPGGKRLVVPSSGKALAEPPDGRTLVVRDGQESKEYEGIDINSLTFSPDSQRLAYLALQDLKPVVVIDGAEEGQEYDDLAPYTTPPTLRFSPDSQHIAYVALRRDTDTSTLGYHFHWSVVVDKQKRGEYDRIVEGTLCFSPDSKRVAYAGVRGTKYSAVLAGTEAKEYDYIGSSSLSFSPDGKRFGYIAGRGKGKGLRQFPVIDGVEGKEAVGVLALTFNPDSQHTAYMTYKRASEPNVAVGMSVVMDGTVGKEYTQLQMPVYFSPDSQKIAYVTLPSTTRSQGKKSVVVVDQKEGPIYRDVLPLLVFSPDCTHIVYRARNRSNRAVVVMDGVEGASYEDFPVGGPLAFSGTQSFYTVARRDNRVYRVQAEITKE